MKFFWIFVLALVVVFAVPSYSFADQDVFLKPHPSRVQIAPAPQAAPPSQSSQPVQPTQQELEEMLGQKPPQAPPQNVEEYANRYYKNCLAQQNDVLNGENLELLCACTAAKFTENMTMEQISAIDSGSQEGLYQRNRILMFVYAPCIEFPTRALIMNQCLNDTKNQYTMKNQLKTCTCLAEGVAGDLKEQAPEVIKNALALNPKDLDPLSLLMNSSAFETRFRNNSLRCLQLHELGYAQP